MTTQPAFTPLENKPQDDLPEGVERDQWGRPKIIPIGGGKPVAYTRISTLCKALKDGSDDGLSKWYGRMTALGVARRPDLAAHAAVLTSSDEDKPELNKLVEEAMAAAGAHKARNLGSAFHRLAEIADTRSDDLSHVSGEMLADLDAYMHATADFEVIAAEKFVVLDELKAAGTFDRLLRTPDGKIRVADIKTGKDTHRFPLDVAVQCGLYANGSLYDPSTGKRTPLDGVETDSALLIHLPAGTGTCTVYLLDTRGAIPAAQVAVTIREWRKQKLATPYKP